MCAAWGFLCCSSSLCFLSPHHLQEVDPHRLSHTPSSTTPPGCQILPSHCFLPSPPDSFGHTSPLALGRQRSDLLWAVPSAQTCSWREPSGVCSVSSAGQHGPGLSSTSLCQTRAGFGCGLQHLGSVGDTTNVAVKRGSSDCPRCYTYKATKKGKCFNLDFSN